MRNSVQWLLSILVIAVGGVFFGVVGLALAGIAVGMMLSSSKRGFLLGGTIAALFWLAVAVVKIVNGQSQQLLALAGSLAQLSGAKAWLLVMISTAIAFLAGGLGGWLGGSLRQAINKPSSLQPVWHSKNMHNARMLLLLIGVVGIISACSINKDSAARVPIRVMSFNIRFNNPADGENAWPNRKDMVASMMQFHEADLVGIQEALKEQMDDLAKPLPEYKWIGVGRDDGKEAGEYSAIFYHENRLTDLQHGTFWLSATPETAGSMGWDAACVRIVTWAKFKDQKTGKAFYHFNTHFDHIGEKARQESAKLLLHKIGEMVKREPVIVTGDFNATDESPVYKILTTGSTGDSIPNAPILLRDARYIASQPHHGPDWTFHGFETVADRPRIDYIFVSNKMQVERHGVLSDRWNGRYPSDHLPVLAELFF